MTATSPLELFLGKAQLVVSSVQACILLLFTDRRRSLSFADVVREVDLSPRVSSYSFVSDNQPIVTGATNVSLGCLPRASKSDGPDPTIASYQQRQFLEITVRPSKRI
jgi:hypothetical protein